MRLFFKYFFKTIHFFIGPIILLWDAVTTPKGMERDEAMMTAGPIRLRPVMMTAFSTVGSKAVIIG